MLLPFITSLKLILADKKTKKTKIIWFHTMSSATKYVPPDPKSCSLPQSAISRLRSHAQENRTAELNKAIISLTCRQFKLKILLSYAALQAKRRGVRGIWSPRRSYNSQNQAKCNNRTEKKGTMCLCQSPFSFFHIFHSFTLCEYKTRNKKKKKTRCFCV